MNKEIMWLCIGDLLFVTVLNILEDTGVMEKLGLWGALLVLKYVLLIIVLTVIILVRERDRNRKKKTRSFSFIRCIITEYL